MPGGGDWLTAVQGWLPPTVAPFELVWSVPAVVGWASYSVRYARAWRQRARERQQGLNGARGLVLAGRCVRFLCLAVAFECLLGVGLVSLLVLPGGLRTGDPWGWLTPALLVAAQLVLLAKGLWLDRTEAALRRLLELRQAAGPGHE